MEIQDSVSEMERARENMAIRGQEKTDLLACIDLALRRRVTTAIAQHKVRCHLFSHPGRLELLFRDGNMRVQLSKLKVVQRLVLGVELGTARQK